jgi:hypothetical protein
VVIRGYGVKELGMEGQNGLPGIVNLAIALVITAIVMGIVYVVFIS